MSEKNYEIVEAVRRLVRRSFKDATEEVKYGGILFTSNVHFCGVFAYKEHVTVEFGSGAKIVDTNGHLEGSGKGRRHIKLMSTEDIKSKKLDQYILLAHSAASAA